MPNVLCQEQLQGIVKQKKILFAHFPFCPNVVHEMFGVQGLLFLVQWSYKAKVAASSTGSGCVLNVVLFACWMKI